MKCKQCEYKQRIEALENYVNTQKEKEIKKVECDIEALKEKAKTVERIGNALKDGAYIPTAMMARIMYA